MISLRLDDSLLNRLRNLVYWTPGTTMEKEVSRALDKYILDIEFRKGQPFQQRLGNNYHEKKHTR